ncbi:hypothetical protein NERG_01506 [Nematocida ausubeli]|uniref:Uncharacterized protein n=1 Tax=Nematocida ausubeli (strain ATCC PRA-371 / ERTm2) TaxID=1913371 RepID=H8ZD35_NEMA1|nr:hypothetical protein NERG_01506 [Nematocida ausubeli]
MNQETSIIRVELAKNEIELHLRNCLDDIVKYYKSFGKAGIYYVLKQVYSGTISIFSDVPVDQKSVLVIMEDAIVKKCMESILFLIEPNSSVSSDTKVIELLENNLDNGVFDLSDEIGSIPVIENINKLCVDFKKAGIDINIYLKSMAEFSRTSLNNIMPLEQLNSIVNYYSSVVDKKSEDSKKYTGYTLDDLYAKTGSGKYLLDEGLEYIAKNQGILMDLYNAVANGQRDVQENSAFSRGLSIMTPENVKLLSSMHHHREQIQAAEKVVNDLHEVMLTYYLDVYALQKEIEGDLGPEIINEYIDEASESPISTLCYQLKLLYPRFDCTPYINALQAHIEKPQKAPLQKPESQGEDQKEGVPRKISSASITESEDEEEESTIERRRILVKKLISYYSETCSYLSEIIDTCKSLTPYQIKYIRDKLQTMSSPIMPLDVPKVTLSTMYRAAMDRYKNISKKTKKILFFLAFIFFVCFGTYIFIESIHMDHQLFM